MSKKILHRVIPLLTVVFLFSTLVTPAFADGTPVSVVDISDSIKEVSYTNDDVYVTYDVPLDPFSSIYGFEVGSDTLTHILDSTNISFSQDSTETISFFTSVFSLDGSFSRYDATRGIYFYYGNHNPGLLADTYRNVTHMVVNDVVYPVVASGSWGSSFRISNFSSDLNLFPFEPGQYLVCCDALANGNLYLYFYSFVNEEFSLSLGYYETEEVLVSEYDSISGITYPLGYSPTDFPNFKVIDVSDLRSGSSFDVTFDYRFAAEFEGAVSGGSLRFKAAFLDENFDLLNTLLFDTLEFSATATNSSYSSTFTLPEDAAYFFIQFDLTELNVSECKSYEFVMSSLELTVPVSSVEYNSKQMDEINTKLEELKNQQQETNDKLDEIISGSPGANAGADNMQDAAGDYKDKVNDQLQNGQAQMDKLDQLPRPDVSGAVTLPEWATSDQFLGFNAVVATIWENETIYEIMVVASILMLASYILFGKKV